MSLSFRRVFAWLTLATILFVPVGCGAGQEAAQKKPPPAPEPADAPPPEKKPAGRVVEVGPAPEGIVADPETGLVAVALRNPNELALVDGQSGETVRKVELPESARHLDLAGPGGPVLVPAEGSDSLVQVSLPDGKITSETPVGDFPHAAAAAPNGRIFVANEKDDTASVVEDGRKIRDIKTPLGPGGVAVTGDGLVGIVGVRGLTLEVYEADTLESVGKVDAGGGPTHGRDELWVTLTAEQSVVRFAMEGRTLREISRYPTVRQPNSVAVDPASGRV